MAVGDNMTDQSILAASRNGRLASENRPILFDFSQATENIESMKTRRPELKLLDESVVEGIIDQAWELLARTGVWLEDTGILEKMGDRGFEIDRSRQRIFFKRADAEPLTRSAPATFRVFGRDEQEGVEIGGHHTVFDPGSAALHWLEAGEQKYRRGTARDCMLLARLTELLPGYRLQSTGIVPSDLPLEIADCCRLYFCLVYCSKPIVTGTFRKESFRIMERMLRVVSDRPMAIFDCCPSPPLKWPRLTLNALLDCARSGLPAEMVAMPVAGATAPVTLIGTVTQHTAECLSGLVMHQATSPGAPIVWGGSPAAFDMRQGTLPMGAMETMMIDLAYSQVGKHLRLPTHAYMACSDAKLPDYQAGMESGIGAVLAALGAVNVVSGPGFLNYENTQSPEKLVLDNDACALACRLVAGIGIHPDPDPVELIHSRAEDGNFLADRTTQRMFRKELSPAGRCVDRSSVAQWADRGSPTARDTAGRELEKLLADPPKRLDDKRRSELRAVLLEEARNLGLADQLEEVLDAG